MGMIYVQEFPNATPPETKIGNTTGFGTLTYSQMTAQGVYQGNNRPIFVKWHGDLFLAGAYTRVLVRHATDRRWLTAGLRGPSRQVSVAAGSGSGGSTGAALCFITFLHKEGDRVMVESDRSNIVSLSVTGEGFDWTNIQAEGAEFRTTHVRGYRSMNGADYRMAWEAPYGATSISENVPTARLSMQGPDPLAHQVPPAGVRFMHPFSNRMWWANTAEFPYRLWYSPAGMPQYTGKLAFRDTKERETITGIWRGRNELLVFCEDSCYKARIFGAGADDIVLEKLDSDVGCISHHGIFEIHNRVWFPSRDGYWVYDGSFWHLMKDLYPLWTEDFKANEAAFRDSWVIHDRRKKCVLFVTGRTTPAEWENTGLTAGTVRYVAYYADWERSLLGQEPQPDWMLDLLGRRESTGYSNDKGEVFFASCDGVIRKQDDTNDDDDGDSLGKHLIIRPGHQLFFEPGDDILSAKSIVQHWHYVESENNAWTLYILGGDEDAWRQIRPDNLNYFWKADVPASLLQEQRLIGGSLYDLTFCAKSVHFFEPERASGRGFTFEIQANTPLGMKYRGFGGLWGPGHATRPAAVATIVT